VGQGSGADLPHLFDANLVPSGGRAQMRPVFSSDFAAVASDRMRGQESGVCVM